MRRRGCGPHVRCTRAVDYIIHVMSTGKGQGWVGEDGAWEWVKRCAWHVRVRVCVEAKIVLDSCFPRNDSAH